MAPLLAIMLQAIVPPADIEFRSSIRARSLTIEKRGDARLTLTGNGANVADIRAPKANGRKRIADPEIDVNVQVRIAETPQLPLQD